MGREQKNKHLLHSSVLPLDIENSQECELELKKLLRWSHVRLSLLSYALVVLDIVNLEF